MNKRSDTAAVLELWGLVCPGCTLGDIAEHIRKARPELSPEEIDAMTVADLRWEAQWALLRKYGDATPADRAILEVLPDTGHRTAGEIYVVLDGQFDQHTIERRLRPAFPLRKAGLVLHEVNHGYRKK